MDLLGESSGALSRGPSRDLLGKGREPVLHSKSPAEWLRTGSLRRQIAHSSFPVLPLTS